jgi:hypothetical protein
MHNQFHIVKDFTVLFYLVWLQVTIEGCGSAFIWYGSGSSILGWIPIRIQRFWWPKIGKKITAEKKIKNIHFLSNTTIYLSLGLHKGRLSYKRSLQLSNMNIQHFKTWNFFIFFFFVSFLPSWIRIRIPNTDPDPDPLTWLNPDLIGIRIRNPGYNRRIKRNIVRCSNSVSNPLPFPPHPSPDLSGNAELRISVSGFTYSCHIYIYLDECAYIYITLWINGQIPLLPTLSPSSHPLPTFYNYRYPFLSHKINNTQNDK